MVTYRILSNNLNFIPMTYIAKEEALRDLEKIYNAFKPAMKRLSKIGETAIQCKSFVAWIEERKDEI